MRVPSRRSLAAAAVATALLLAGACSSGSTGSTGSPTTAAGPTKGADTGPPATGVAPSQLTGDLTATNGFKPGENGFSFQNYGKVDGRPNLTADEVRRFFGDSVCASLANGTCTLTPPAEQWMQQVSDGMNGGHCEGMAALALLLYKGTVKLADIVPGASNTWAAAIEGNDKLAKEIAYWWATQTIEPSSTAEVKDKKPSEIVSMLKDSFKDGAEESYTLGIYKTVDGKKTAGHAITPYGLVEKGEGKVEIAVYDNNFPAQPRAVVVDTGADKWSYSAAADPTQPESLYEGDASTFSLTLTPTSSRLKSFTCPFCSAAAPAAGFGKGVLRGEDGGASMGQLFLNENAGDKGVVVTVTDLDGNALSGVRSIDPKNSDDINAIPTITQIPAGVAFKVKIDGSALKESVTTDITYIGPELDQYIDGINLDPGQIDTATFRPTSGALTYETTSSESPTIGIGFSSPGADYDFSVGGVDLPSGGAVEARVDLAAGSFTVSNLSSSTGTYALTMDRIDDNGEQSFSKDDVELVGGAVLVFPYTAWTTKGDVLKAEVQTPSGAPTPLELTSDK